jgi:hypothetical protein
LKVTKIEDTCQRCELPVTVHVAPSAAIQLTMPRLQWWRCPWCDRQNERAYDGLVMAVLRRR